MYQGGSLHKKPLHKGEEAHGRSKREKHPHYLGASFTPLGLDLPSLGSPFRRNVQESPCMNGKKPMAEVRVRSPHTLLQGSFVPRRPTAQQALA